jgi:hypothetical protein
MIHKILLGIFTLLSQLLFYNQPSLCLISYLDWSSNILGFQRQVGTQLVPNESKITLTLIDIMHTYNNYKTPFKHFYYDIKNDLYNKINIKLLLQTVSMYIYSFILNISLGKGLNTSNYIFHSSIQLYKRLSKESINYFLNLNYEDIFLKGIIKVILLENKKLQQYIITKESYLNVPCKQSHTKHLESYVNTKNTNFNYYLIYYIVGGIMLNSKIHCTIVLRFLEPFQTFPE